MPGLEALHLGNNSLDASQAAALAASITKHKIVKLENLTLGSNDIGDAGAWRAEERGGGSGMEGVGVVVEGVGVEGVEGGR